MVRRVSDPMEAVVGYGPEVTRLLSEADPQANALFEQAFGRASTKTYILMGGLLVGLGYVLSKK